MKVLLINGSPNVEGCTYTALEEVSTTLNKEGIETEIIHVGNKDIRGCIACRKCRINGKCVFNDLVNEVAPKFEEADGIVLGSPVYYGSPNGGAISFIDRLFYSTTFDKKFKVGFLDQYLRIDKNLTIKDYLNKAFDELQLETLKARVLKKNTRSAKTFISNGFSVLNKTEIIHSDSGDEEVVFFECTKGK
jgi:multimeric flavodoxin WrbA